jgi:uncharacterized small protein (DUF1192 family)
MTSTLAYSSATGQETVIDDDIVVEHHRPTNLKVTDPRYGLKTAAKTAAERKAKQEQRDAFITARNEALTRQRDGIQARLGSLQKEIRKVVAQLEAGTISGESAVDDAFARLHRMGGTEAKLVSDIARLNQKIGC